MPCRLFKKKSSCIGLLLVILLVAGFLLRFSSIGKPPWFDEAFSVFMAGKDVSNIFLALQHGLDVHQPLYYFLLHYWMEIGESAEWLRLLSLLFGVALIPVVYQLGKELLDEEAGLMAAALVSFSNVLAHYSIELRPYSLLAFFFSVSLLFLFRLLRGQPIGRNKNTIGFAVFSILTIFSHHFGFLFVFTGLLLLLVYKRPLRSIVFLGLLIGVGAWPSLLILSGQSVALGSGFHFTWANQVDFEHFAAVFEYFSNNLLAEFFFLVFFLASLFYWIRKKDPKILFLTILFFVPMLLAAVISFLGISKIFFYRYFIPLSVVFFLLVIAGVRAGIRPKNQRLAFLFLFFFFLLPFPSTLPQPSGSRYGSCFEFVYQKDPSPQLVVASDFFFNVAFYYRGAPEKFFIFCPPNQDSGFWDDFCALEKKYLGNSFNYTQSLIQDANEISGPFFFLGSIGDYYRFKGLFSNRFEIQDANICMGALKLVHYVPR